MKKGIIFFFLLFPFCLSAQTITIFAGTGGGFGGDGGPATAAGIPDPGGGAFDSYGNYYFVDAIPGERVRMISNAGIISTIAGTGTYGFNGDNIPATTAELNSPTAVRLDSLGNFYICDQANNRIRKINIATGIITTFAGNGTGGFSGDNGPATAAMIQLPQDICFDKYGNLYIGDVTNHRIRKVNTSGIITTVAGNGTPGSMGDNGPATAAEIRTPGGLATDDVGNLYIADGIENNVRKVNPSGIITTIAGTGIGTYSGDGIPATSAQINPIKLALDAYGQLFIADNYNNRVYKIDSNGILFTIAGNGGTGLTGYGGPATAATIDFPSGLAFDACGNLYIPEADNQVIAKITCAPILSIPTITLSREPSSAIVGASVTITATVTNAGSSYNIEWYNHGIQFATTTVPSVTYIKPLGIDTITAKVVSTATYGCYDSTTSPPDIITVGASGIGTVLVFSYSIYPNPANDIIHIDGIISSSSYRLLNIIGSVLQQGFLHQGSNSIPMQSLPVGMYMIEVIGSDNRRVITKIVRQ